MRAVGLALLRELTATLWHRLQAQHRRCLHWGGRDGERCGPTGAELLTACGAVERSRQRVRRRAGGPFSQPLDDGLKALGGHRATWLGQALIGLAGARGP